MTHRSSPSTSDTFRFKWVCVLCGRSLQHPIGNGSLGKHFSQLDESRHCLGTAVRKLETTLAAIVAEAVHKNLLGIIGNLAYKTAESARTLTQHEIQICGAFYRERDKLCIEIYRSRNVTHLGRLNPEIDKKTLGDGGAYLANPLFNAEEIDFPTQCGFCNSPVTLSVFDGVIRIRPHDIERTTYECFSSRWPLSEQDIIWHRRNMNNLPSLRTGNPLMAVPGGVVTAAESEIVRTRDNDRSSRNPDSGI